MATTERTAETWSVGRLAAAAGTTVRTLHHYDEIGLLRPADRSDAGHRRYTVEDVERLYRIGVLRRLGLPLAEIAGALDGPAGDLRGALQRQLDALDARLAREQALRRRIAGMLAGGAPSSDELVAALGESSGLEGEPQRRITILVYEDIAAAAAHLVDVFGLGPARVDRSEDGTAMHGEVEAGDGVVWLHRVAPEHGLVSPRTLGAATASMAVIVDDVDAHYERAVAAGADGAYGPVDQPYGYREWSAHDPEGVLWSFMHPL